MFLYPSVPTLDEHGNLLGITAVAYQLDALSLPVHFLHDAHRGTARFVQLLLDKHVTKVALIIQMLPDEVDFLSE